MSAVSLRQSPTSKLRGAEIDRVVVISDDVFSLGGAGGVARENVISAVRRGFRVTVLVGIEASTQDLPAGVEIVPMFGDSLNENAGLSSAIGGIFNLGVRNRVARWIAAHDTPSTIYHLHNWHKSLSPSVFHALRTVDRRLLMTAHDYFLVCPNGAYYNFRTQQACGLSPLSPKCVTENCDKRRYLHKAWRVARHSVRAGLFALGRMQGLVLAPHEGVAPYLVRGGVRSDRIKVLRNAVTPWTARRVEAESQEGVLFVGRIEADKGVHLVCDAAERCGVTLTVVGDGPLAASLSRTYPRHRFLGRKTRAEIAEIAVQTRLLICAPLWPETFGLVTFEGLLSGVPTMISKSAVVADELRRLEVVEVFDGEDVASFAEHLLRLRSDAARLKTLSCNGFALRGKLAPTADSWSSELINIYRAILNEAAS